MLLVSDIHLKPDSSRAVFEALEAVLAYAVAHGHRSLAALGDTFHFRYAVPVAELNQLDRWLDSCVNQGLDVNLLVGNHDAIDVEGQNALEVLARPGVRVYTEPTENEHGLWLPYRVHKNVYIDPIARSSARRAFVHHGLIGAEMNNGIVAGEKDGLPLQWFSRFETVFLGHWHRHQVIGNCVYVGSLYQTKLDEAGQTKGFLELDEVSGKWRQVPIAIGRRFHRSDAPGFTEFRPGDVVRVPHGTPEQLVADFIAKGAEVRVEPPPQTPTQVRLGTATSIRDKAVGYVEARALDPAYDKALLMKIFDEIASTPVGS